MKSARSLHSYNDWAARASLLLQGGRHVADIGVLYPVATMQAYARFDKVDGPHPGLTMPKNTDFNALSDLLTGGIRRDFTFLHPEILDGKCRINGAKLRLENKINFEDYSVIIIPSVSTIHWSNLQKIKAFYDAGGKVIATTQLPTSSAEFGHDREVQRRRLQRCSPPLPVNDQGYARKTNEAGGASYFVPSLNDNGSALAAALRMPCRCADVRFGPGAPLFTHLPQSGSRPSKEGETFGMLSYIHKVKDGRNIYLLRELDRRTCGGGCCPPRQADAAILESGRWDHNRREQQRRQAERNALHTGATETWAGPVGVLC